MSDLSDPRFSRIAFDPKFKPVQHAQRKVKVDKRFAAMFTDEAFKASTTKDKRGRPFADRQAEGLDRFYELDEEEEEEEAEEADYDLKGRKYRKESESQSSSESEADDETGSADSSESTGEEDDAEDEVKDEENTTSGLDKDWDELDKNAPTIDDATNRIAICNLDWQRVKASDLFVMMSSFLPQNADQRKKSTTLTRRGEIKLVEIFPSQFGLERMRTEQLQGPVIPASRAAEPNADKDNQDQSVKAKNGKAVNSRKKKRQVVEEKDTDEQEDEGYKRKSKGKREESESAALNRLRKYELDRLRYYFAIVEFDSVSTAQYVYENCDGCEFESSGMRLDLRFVPDDVQFDDERQQRDSALSANQDDLIWRVATQCSSMPADPSHFEHLSDAKYFTFSALQQTSKVDLGWDRTSADRQRTLLRANTISKNELEKMDLKAYLRCSDSESDSDAHEDDYDDDNEVGDESKVADPESDMESEAGSTAEDEQNTKSQKKKNKMSEIEKYRALIREIEDNGGRRKRQKKAQGSDSEKEDSESDEDCYNMEVSWEGPFDDGKAAKSGSRAANNKRGKESEANSEKHRGKGKKKEVEETKKRKRRADDDMAEVDAEQRERDAAGLSLIVGRDAAAADRRDAKNKFTFNVRDDRFAAMYSEPDFNVDPSANELRQAFGAKRNAAQYLSTIANEKAKRRKRV